MQYKSKWDLNTSKSSLVRFIIRWWNLNRTQKENTALLQLSRDDLVLLNSSFDYHDEGKYCFHDIITKVLSEALLEVVDVVFSKLPMLQTQLCFAENKNWLANY